MAVLRYTAAQSYYNDQIQQGQLVAGWDQVEVVVHSLRPGIFIPLPGLRLVVELMMIAFIIQMLF